MLQPFDALYAALSKQALRAGRESRMGPHNRKAWPRRPRVIRVGEFIRRRNRWKEKAAPQTASPED